MIADRLLADPPTALVMDLLNDGGEEARLVGGAVRNALLGRAVTDLDVTTTAEPAVVIERARAAGLRVIPTGIVHGTVTLVVAGRSFEVTTLREDVETDGRHAVIRFGRDFAKDALRRDFTVNALSLDRAGTVHDYAGGLADLRNGRVRFIGDAATRIREDYLRTLRFYRFSAEYAAGAIDRDGRDATIRERGGLERLSRERVHQELMKLLVAPRASEVCGIMADAGLLGPLLRSVPLVARLRRLIADDPGADAVLRLAGVAVAIREDADRLREALKLSNGAWARLAGAAAVRERMHGQAEAPSPRQLRQLLFEHGRQATADGLSLLRAERAPAEGAAWQSAQSFVADTPEPRLPFSGADLIARGIPAGPSVGALLKRLQADWIRAGFPQDPRALAQLLESAVDAP